MRTLSTKLIKNYDSYDRSQPTQLVVFQDKYLCVSYLLICNKLTKSILIRLETSGKYSKY